MKSTELAYLEVICRGANKLYSERSAFLMKAVLEKYVLVILYHCGIFIIKTSIVTSTSVDRKASFRMIFDQSGFW